MSSWSTPQSPIVSTDWLFEHLNSPDVHIVDASWYMPNSGINPKTEYEKCHIPNAVFFDIDEICETNTSLPHMAPSPEKFSSRARSLGMGDGIRIVIYDQQGIFSAPRVWWMFRLMGHEDVVILDGGLKKWLSENKPVEDMLPIRRERHFSVKYRNDLIKDFTQVLNACENKKAYIFDARSANRFLGREQEPRAGLNSGHIPNSINFHYASFINENGTLKSKKEIENIFNAHNLDLKKPIILSCGTGITACIIGLALARIGHYHAAVYDGSWTEWGSRDDAPIESEDFETI